MTDTTDLEEIKTCQYYDYSREINDIFEVYFLNFVNTKYKCLFAF